MKEKLKITIEFAILLVIGAAIGCTLGVLITYLATTL